MRQGLPGLKASSALPLVLGALAGAIGGALAATPAAANCAGGLTITCDSAAPNPHASTVGTGRNDHNRTVNVLGGGRIVVTDRNAISLGDNARINLASGARVQGTATANGDGRFGTGMQPIEFNSYGLLVVAEGARVIERGTDHRAEAVNVHGVGNRIVNHGLISGQSSAALWFEDEIRTGPRNLIDNYGTIEQTGGGAVIGTTGGAGIDFFNQTGARVEGDLIFAGGDDNLFFFADSTVTGSIDGGAGDNALTLEGALGSSDTLDGGLRNFQTLAKDGLGRWTITSSLSGFRSTTVRLGTLALTGANVGYAAGVGIDAGGTLEARAQSLPVRSNPAENLANIRNDGLLRFVQDDSGSYLGQITGAGAVEKTGAGLTTLAPSAGVNTYAGGTRIDQGTLAVAADAALGAASGGLTLDGGTLRTTASFAMARPATLLAGGGTFEPTTGTLDETGVIGGPGKLTKTGAGALALGGANSYGGGTQVDAGAVQVAADTALGAPAGALTLDGGALRTTASFSTARATTLGTGGGTFDTTTGALRHGGVIGGDGPLAKTGAGALVLSGANSYGGATTVGAGTLIVNGDQSAATGVATALAGATLGGTGTIGGDVTIADGATLSPGGLGAAAGTLGIGGDLSLGATSRLAYDFGQASVVGGPLNDLTRVAGDLTLDGTLDVTTTPGGAFDPGVYRVISYEGALDDRGLAIGAIPSPKFYLQTSIAKQVNLVNTAGLTLDYWDGDAGAKNDAVVNGGDGTWKGSGGTDNWTESTGTANAPFDSGAFAVFTGAAGTVSVDNGLGGVTVSGMQFATDGYRVQGDPITLAGAPQSIVRVGDGSLAGAGVTAAVAAELTGAAQLRKTDLGTLVLQGANSYTGGTAIDGGVVEIADDASLGAAGTGLSFDSGTLRTTADLTMARPTTLAAGGGTLETAGGVTLTHRSDITGSGALGKTGSGTVVLTGAAGHAGGTTIGGGTLQLGDGGRSGSLAGDITNDGLLVFDRSDALAVAGAISGSGAVRQLGAGTTSLGGVSSYAGGTEILGGTLAVAADASLGAAAGPLSIDGATLRTTAGFATGRATSLGPSGGTFDAASGILAHGGVVSGAGGLTKSGAGTLVLGGTNSYAGATRVGAGALYVNGDQAAATGATTALAGSVLGGIGTIGGDVTIAGGATLAPGRADLAPGTLRVAGGLALGAGAFLDYGFGQANVVGGPLNDLTEVAGDLSLDGTLNVATTAGGSFDPGVYRLISYGGALTDRGLAIGTVPSDGFHVQTSIPRQVNLVNTAGLTLNHWDGGAGPKNDAAIDGGDGTWHSAAGNDNWTESTGSLNAPFADGAFAIFAGAPGTVAVDESLGAVRAAGMQFAVDGYHVHGAPIELVGDTATVRVGDGTSAGAGFRALVRAPLTGAARLRKTDLGTLDFAFGPGHSYTGGTAIDGGTLQISDNAQLGAPAGDLSLDGGTLRTWCDCLVEIDRAVTLGAGGGTLDAFDMSALEVSGAIAGAGALTVRGSGVFLTGANSYAGGTTIESGLLALGRGGATGSIVGDVANEGTLAFARADAMTFAGSISGSGSVWQSGTGITTLTGTNSYAGATTLTGGTLEAGAAGVFSAASAHAVSAGATLQLDDFDQRVARLRNAGRVSLGHVSGTRLTVEGDYVGEGGVLHFTTELAGDGSRTDRLTVGGDTSGTGVIEVANDGGGGAQTADGIKLIDVEGASNATFTLVGDTVVDGRPVVVAGAFAYALWKNGLADPADGDWYLRSQVALEPSPPGPGPAPGPGPQPGPPQVQPGVPIYEAYPRVLLALNGLPTMQERVGNRYWPGAGGARGLDTTLPSGDLVEDRRAWARVEGARVGLEPDVDFGGRPEYAIAVWKLQLGMDRPVREDDTGLLIAGLTVSYGTADADVAADAGDGRITTDGYGFGGSLTWLGHDGLYVDGQAQVMWFDSDLGSDAVAEDLASGNDGFGYALGVEAGKRIPWKGAWTVTPQAQLAYSSIDFDDFTDPFDAAVAADAGASMPVRLGVSLDQEREGGDGRRTHFYGITNLYYDLVGETEVAVGGTGLTSRGDRLWGSLGIGGTYSWADGRYAVYGEGLVSSSLENPGESYANSATLGLRIAW